MLEDDVQLSHAHWNVRPMSETTTAELAYRS
jgi:hypothetical protein